MRSIRGSVSDVMRVYAWLSLLVVIATACGPAAPRTTARTGGTLVYAAAADVDNLDPAQRGGTISTAAKRLVYNSVVKQTPDNEIQPDLATAWKADGNT